jgi:hypothetical protein
MLFHQKIVGSRQSGNGLGAITPSEFKTACCKAWEKMGMEVHVEYLHGAIAFERYGTGGGRRG